MDAMNKLLLEEAAVIESAAFRLRLIMKQAGQMMLRRLHAVRMYSTA